MITADPIFPAVSIKTRILFSFLMVILVLSVAIAALGYRVIQKDVIESAERKVLNDLKVAEMVYTNEIERIGQALRLARPMGISAR
jgi:peptidoglycan/LPS O-acetylase OafA/YrhL